MRKKIGEFLFLVFALSLITIFPGCNKDGGEVIMMWGPEEHRELYMTWAEEFRALYPEQLEGVSFDYAGSGDAGAYGNMTKDPTMGAAVYTFANDQMANLANLGALSNVFGENLEWSRANNTAASVEGTKLGDNYVAYPLQADNGYFMYFNRDAFKGTSIWDTKKDTLKEGFTFRDMYAALDERATQEGGEKWANGKVTWALGDSWYVSGVFFAVGGDYSVKYNAEGKQESADCWFAYPAENPNDCTVGLNAVECMLNTFLNEDGTINKHFKYTDGDKSPLNDTMDLLANSENKDAQKTPLAAAISGTWKAANMKKYWGDNYDATVLPMLECDEGLYTFKNFCGFKNIGVNPLSSFARNREDGIELLHKFAQYLSSKDAQLARYQATGAGPSNLEALQDEEVANDVALKALNDQYARECRYPEGSVNAGKLVGDGKGFRVQDSVPANYWTPIQNFGQKMWQEYEAGSLVGFLNETTITRELKLLQNQIAQAAQ